MPFAQAVTRHSIQGGLDQIFCQTLLSCLNDADEKPQFRQIVQPYCPCLSSTLFKRGTRYVYIYWVLLKNDDMKWSWNIIYELEPSCCTKRQKKSPGQETGLGNRGRQKVLNDAKLMLNDQGGHSCSFRTNLVSFRTFRRPLFPKPVSCPGLFFYRFLHKHGSR